MRAWLCCLVVAAACEPHADVAGTKVALRGDDCVGCHVDAWQATRAPAHGELAFGQECGGCHDQQSWSPAHGFAHTAAFPLTLAHALPACASCHASGFARGATPSSCIACHGDRAATVSDPVHAGLSQSCSACHKTDAFRPSTFVHAWPLKGAHAREACGSCHAGTPALYEGTVPACSGCHADDRARADLSVSGHRSNPSTCESCHGFESFRTNATR